MLFWKKKTDDAARERPVPATPVAPEIAPVQTAEPEPPVVPAVEEKAAPLAVEAPAIMPTFVAPPPEVSLARRFCQDGFVHVPQVFDPALLADVRRAAISHLPENKPPFEQQFSYTAPFQDPFRQLFSNPRFIAPLRAVLGDDFVFFDQFSLHDSHFVNWHTDTLSVDGRGGQEFHWSPLFCVCVVAIYLQDNGENGGGLDAVPGTHMRDDPSAHVLRAEHGHPFVNRKPLYPEDPYRDGVSLPSHLGDIVFFHSRISHRASQPRRPALGDADRKLGVFSMVGANNLPTRQYAAWLREDAEKSGATRAPIPDDFRATLRAMGHDIL